MKIKYKILMIFIALLGYLNTTAQNNDAIDLVPEGYFVFEQILGDLNKDGVEDCILLIKGTEKKNIVVNRFDDVVDRNRRGVMVFFYKNGQYELVSKNLACFESENEDGGVYFPPQLSIYTKDNKLFVDYTHGRYGYWHYTFRYTLNDFELIGFDSTSTFGPIIQTVTSINFLTKRKLTRKNLNQFEEDEYEEDFEDTWENITIDNPIKLSEIKDFAELNLYDY